MNRRVLLAFVLCAVWVPGATADEPKVITPAEARQHVDEVCTVEYKVLSGRLLGSQKVCFLNSQADHRSNDNFTTVIYAAGLSEFEEQDIADPAEYFRDKTIRVTGKIGLHEDKPQIVVTEAKQIELKK